jgi:formate dehydrogenase
VDLNAAIARVITVAEVTFCSSISVAGHAIMQILALVRNFVPSNDWITRGGWNIADCVERTYDLEGMEVGILAAGRIGLAVLRRLAPFDVRLHYSQRHRLSPEVEQELALTFHPDARSLAQTVDVPFIHSPLVPETYHLFDDTLLGSMQRGSSSSIPPAAPSSIATRWSERSSPSSWPAMQAMSGIPSPPPLDHPWRTMSNNAMTTLTPRYHAPRPSSLRGSDPRDP